MKPEVFKNIVDILVNRSTFENGTYLIGELDYESLCKISKSIGGLIVHRFLVGEIETNRDLYSFYGITITDPIKTIKYLDKPIYYAKDNRYYHL